MRQNDGTANGRIDAKESAESEFEARKLKMDKKARISIRNSLKNGRISLNLLNLSLISQILTNCRHAALESGGKSASDATPLFFGFHSDVAMRRPPMKKESFRNVLQEKQNSANNEFQKGGVYDEPR